MMRSRLLICFLSIALLLSTQAQAYKNPEQQVLQALEIWQQGDGDKAEYLLSQLLKLEPEFRLAYLLRADILKSKTTAIETPAEGINGAGNEIQQLLLEVRSRWQAQKNHQLENKIPASLVMPSHNSRYIFAIDLKLSRLYIFKNKAGQPELLDDYYISMGRGGADKKQEGDLRTPLGVYFVQSFLPPVKLDDKYGAGAYPLNYPNAWDKFNQRTGSGIWLHGTRSGTYNRPPLASEGCVVLPNNDLIKVGNYIDIGQTTVIIGNGLHWLSKSQWQQQQAELLPVFQNWLDDWQSMDVNTYLQHYSTDFRGDNADYFKWASRKRQLAQHKTFINVEVRYLSLFKHPNEDVLVASFQQKYRSNDFSSSGWKRQYWHKEDGHWRIIFEGKIAAPVLPQPSVLQAVDLDLKKNQTSTVADTGK